MTLVVKNWREVNRAFQKTHEDIRDGWRDERRRIAEPVAHDITAYSLARIRRMPRSPEWSEMRIGVTQKMVYVVPVRKGVGRGGRRNPRSRGYGTGPPSFADLMGDRAMDPAMARNEPEIERRFEHLLDVAADKFNRDG